MEYFRLALSEIYNNKARTFLTLIGIVIGIATVILIIFVIQGAETYVMSELTKIAPVDIFQVHNRYNSDARRWIGQMNYDDIEAIKEKVGPNLKAIAPRYISSGQLRYEGKEESFNMISTTPDFQDIYGLKTETGRFLTNFDIDNFNNVIVLGHETAKNVFKEQDAVGKKINIDGMTFRVVGVLPKDYESPLFPMTINDNRGFVPITVLERLANVKNRFTLMVRIKNRNQMGYVKSQVENVLNTRHGTTNSGRSKFNIYDMASGLEMVSIVKIGLMVLLGGVASITLLVAGIGIMNIMLVIVAERTREIGLRKAIGATRRDILSQFIIESIILCIFGGIFGVVLGYFSSELALNIAQNYININLEVPLWSILISLIFTTGVGLFFGIYPALKAARLDPIEALNYE
jgi:putative ABC transport system permease protein